MCRLIHSSWCTQNTGPVVLSHSFNAVVVPNGCIQILVSCATAFVGYSDVWSAEHSWFHHRHLLYAYALGVDDSVSGLFVVLPPVRHVFLMKNNGGQGQGILGNSFGSVSVIDGGMSQGTYIYGGLIFYQVRVLSLLVSHASV